MRRTSCRGVPCNSSSPLPTGAETKGQMWANTRGPFAEDGGAEDKEGECGMKPERPKPSPDRSGRVRVGVGREIRTDLARCQPPRSTRTPGSAPRCPSRIFDFSFFAPLSRIRCSFAAEHVLSSYKQHVLMDENFNSLVEEQKEPSAAGFTKTKETAAVSTTHTT